MDLLELEKKYSASLDKQYKKLVELYDQIKLKAAVSLEDREITKAILLRMKAYYNAQNKLRPFYRRKEWDLLLISL